MKKLIIIFALISSFAFAAMNPSFKECIQRGYQISNEDMKSYCEFSDNEKCIIEDFNKGLCGQEYMIKDYCVEEGTPVWDKDKCCKGTIAYLKPNHAGQPYCTDISVAERMYNQFRYNPIPNFGLLIFIIILGGLVIWFIKRKN